MSIKRDGNIEIGTGNAVNAKFTVQQNSNTNYAAAFQNNQGHGVAIIAGKENKLVVIDEGSSEINFIVNDNKVGIGNVPKPEATLHVDGDVIMMDKHMWSAPRPPLTGEHRKGDIVWNSLPAVTLPIGWVCIQSGIPGIWSVFGRIE